MISIIFLISALTLGIAITKRLGLKLYSFEAPALAVSLGLFLWTWLSYITSLLLPYVASLTLTIIIAAIATTLLYRPGSWHWQPSLPRTSRWAWASFTTITTLGIGWLMWTHDLIARGGELYSANATWADFGLHASLINHIAVAQHLPTDFPIAAGAHLTYPFLIDLLSAWFVYGGWSLHMAIFIPSILLVVAALQLLLGFSLRTFRSLGGGVLGLTLMLLCGSAGGGLVALQNFHSSGQTFWQFLGQLPQDYTVLNMPNMQVSNFLADALLPQRAFLFGLAIAGAVLTLIAHLRHAPSRPLFVFTGALIGLLPLAHAHTFVILMAILGSLYVEAALKQRRLINHWAFSIGAALVLAGPQILWQSHANGTGTGGHWSPGWVINPGETLGLFLLHNYGLTLGLIIATAIVLATLKPLRRYLVFYVPLCAIFIGANLYALQPFAYDNLKLIYYVYLFTYLFAGYGAIWLIRRYRPALIIIALAVIILCTSGSLAIAREFQRQDQFASADDIALAAWAKQATPADAVFAATDRPNQPLATLAGRTIIMGYRGWLYDYHLPYEARLQAIQQALSGQLTTANPYQAGYVAVASTEPAEWTVDQAALIANYHLVYTNASWAVYQLPAK
jgi:hypothetical protein